MHVVFDLDGTLADDSHRNHYLEKEPRDWEGYYSEVLKDDPVIPLLHVARALYFSRDPMCVVDIWTGRPEKVREETKLWLARYGIRYRELKMRPNGDHRRDTELKEGWMEHGKPNIMFDDRTRSIAHWRSLGICAVQVAQHDF